MPKPKSKIIKKHENMLDMLDKLEDSMDCQILQTKILSKKTAQRKSRQKKVEAMTAGIHPITVLVAEETDKVFSMVKDDINLVNGTKFRASKAVSREQVYEAFANRDFDVVIIDCESFANSDEHTSDLIKAVKKAKKYVPVLVFGPVGAYECDMMAMEAGAADFITEDELTPKRLEKAIRYCLRNAC